MEKYSNKEVLKWYNKYKKLKSTRKVAKEFGVSRPTVKQRFKKLGLQLCKDHRKFFCNEKFFERDTPESFYWAGFIAADGCITKNQIAICLGNKDRSHLEKFKRAIKHSGKIRYYDQRPIRNSITVSLSISSKYIVNDLIRFGIKPKKSLTYRFPEWIINHEMLNHFVRGYCDGDGCFFISKTSDAMGFKVRGTEEFLKILRNCLSDNCGVSNNVQIPFDSGIYGLPYNGRINIIKIRNFIYNNSHKNIELSRKRIIAFDKKIGDSVECKNKMPIISTDIDGNDIVFYNTQFSTEMDGFSSSKVCMCINGKRKTHKGRKFRKAAPNEIKKYGRLIK